MPAHITTYGVSSFEPQGQQQFNPVFQAPPPIQAEPVQRAQQGQMIGSAPSAHNPPPSASNLPQSAP